MKSAKYVIFGCLLSALYGYALIRVNFKINIQCSMMVMSRLMLNVGVDVDVDVDANVNVDVGVGDDAIVNM